VAYRLIDTDAEATIQSGSLKIADWLNSRLQVQALSIIKPVSSRCVIDLRNDRHEERKSLQVTGESGDIGRFYRRALRLAVRRYRGRALGFLFLRITRFCLSHIKGVQQIGYHGLWLYIAAGLKSRWPRSYCLLAFGIRNSRLYVVVPRFASAETAVMIVLPWWSGRVAALYAWIPSRRKRSIRFIFGRSRILPGMKRFASTL